MSMTQTSEALKEKIAELTTHKKTKLKEHGI